MSSIVLDGTTFSYTYDDLRRLETVSNGVFTSRYSYWDDEEAGTASPRLKSIVHEGVNYSGKTVECNYTYEYDANGNITAVSFGNRRQTYVYDDNNQLIRENNDRRQYTQTWEYDEFGNITSTSKYAYTTGEPGEPTSTVTYGYTDSDWGDLLTQYNGQTIEYDEIGNPLFVKNGDTVVKSYTWSKGRQMATHMTKGVTWNYSYDISGLRTQRTNGTTTYEYIYAGDKLVRMVKNGEVVDFGYAGGQLATMTYDGVTYYYILNGQGDVVAITDSTGTVIIGYLYSAYGYPTLLKTDSAVYNDLKYLNPFMYRGYVYDIESGLYYLQSRYYDPEVGRFINADDTAYLGADSTLLSYNLFAYCENNPVIGHDPSGEFPLVVLGFAAVGALVNVATSYIAAKVTGQEYTFTDGLVASVTGAACAFGPAGAVVAGLISGGYSACSSYQNGASSFGAFITGIASGLLTGAGIGNIVGLEQIWANLGLQALLDFIFCTGYNSMSAAIYKSVIQSSQNNDNKLNSDELTVTPVVGIGIGPSAGGEFHVGSQKICVAMK